MIALPLVAVLALSAAPIRSLPKAEGLTHVPKLSALTGVGRFLKAIEGKSSVLSPRTLQRDFLPLLGVDALDPASLAAFGIHPDGAATVSGEADARLTCVTLVDAAKFEAKATEALARYGAVSAGVPANVKSKGVKLVTARGADRVLGGFAVKGKEACVLSEAKDPQASLEAAASSLSGKGDVAAAAALKGLSGELFVHLPGSLTAGLSGDEKGAKLDGRSSALRLPKPKAPGSSPYAAAAPSGMFFLRSRADPVALPSLATWVVGRLRPICPACDKDALTSVAQDVAKHLSGETLLRIDGTKKTQLATPAGQFFALRFAWFAEAARPEEAKASLAKLAALKNAKKTEEGFALAVNGGEVRIGFSGKHFYLANDERALTAAKAAIPVKPAKAQHAVDFAVNPPEVARALASVSLFDVMGNQDLAPLLAASAEVGPLLLSSERVEGNVNPEGMAQRVRLSWTLKGPPAPPAPPAAAADAGR